MAHTSSSTSVCVRYSLFAIHYSQCTYDSLYDLCLFALILCVHFAVFHTFNKQFTILDHNCKIGNVYNLLL